ncbi:MAG: hypothetical protein EAS51_08225 [Microbacteriaceae bacterium]|nr:MAG: hypothetical protein EAS51_08225 [Microbacteriaceae bacterium]
MVPSDGVLSDAVTEKSWRGVLWGIALAIGVAFLVLGAPQQARADDRPGLVDGLGSLLGGVASTVEEVVAPVVEPLPALRELPVVGSIVGGVADSRPVATITEPVAGLVERVLGVDVVTPVADPVGGLVDGTLGELAGAPVASPPPVAPDPRDEAVAHVAEPAPAAAAPASGSLAAASPALAATRIIPILGSVGELGIAAATGAEGPGDGPVSLPGGITPTSAVTAAGAPVGAAAAVLGAGLLLLLARGRLRPVNVRIPSSPPGATDSSPD